MSGQTNGLEPPVCIKNALSMSKQELDQYEALVLKGGEVTADGLRARLEVASFLAFVCLGSRMVAIGAIKRASAKHIQVVADNSGFDLRSYRGELGYLYVEPECRRRHFCSRITEGLLHTFADPVFATTRIDNTTVHRLLAKYAFVRRGNTWGSEMHPGTDLCLWVGPRNEICGSSKISFCAHQIISRYRIHTGICWRQVVKTFLFNLDVHSF